MKVRTSGQLLKNLRPLQGKRSCSIDIAKVSTTQGANPLVREFLRFVQARNDLLSDHRTRRNAMGPPQSIEVTREALLPQASHRLWFKAVKPTAGRNIAFLKGLLTITPGRNDTH